MVLHCIRGNVWLGIEKRKTESPRFLVCIQTSDREGVFINLYFYSNKYFHECLVVKPW